MSIVIFRGLNRFHVMHYPQPPQPNMDNKSDNEQNQYNLRGIQVHRSCTRLLLHTPNKFNINCIDDVPIKKLFITNLDKKTTQEDLYNHFRNYGKVEECVVKHNKKSNYAFVTFEKDKSTLQALKNINRIHDKELRVIPADTRHQPGYSKREKEVGSEPKERSAEQSSPSSSVEVYPLVHRISDNCLTNIFQYLPIVDRVRVEGVCRRWRDLSQDSWRTLKRLDVSSSSWGYKNSEIGTSDLYQVLKRCGRFITMITFFEPHRMMSLRTVFIIGKLCPLLKIAYLGTLEVTPREINFLLSRCPNLEFLELDSSHFYDRDFVDIFKKCKKLKYVSFEGSKIDGSCFCNLPEETETLVFHGPVGRVDRLAFQSAFEKLKNLQNLYLSRLQYGDFGDIEFVDEEVGIPIFDDHAGNDDDDYNIYNDDYNNLMMMINEPQHENNLEDNLPGIQDLEWGQDPEPSFRKNDTDLEKTNQSEKKENSYDNKEDATNIRDVGFNDNDDWEERDEYDLFAEYINNDDDDDDFDSEEDFNDISSTLTDVAVPKENEQASTSKIENKTKLKGTDTPNTKTSVTKISDEKISDSKTSDTKASDPNGILTAKFSTNKKNKDLESKKNAKKLVDSTHSKLNDNHELEPDPCGSCSDIKEECRSDDVKQRDLKKDKNYSKDDETSGVVVCKENIYDLDSNDDDYEDYDCQEPSIDEWNDVENEDFDCQEPDIYDVANENYDCQEPDFDDTDCVEDEDDCQEPNFDHRDCVDENDYNCFGLDIDDWGDAVDADDAYDVDYDEEDIFDYDNFEDYEDDYDEYDGYEDYDDIFEIENDLAYESNLSGMIRTTIRNCNENLKIFQLSRCNLAGLTPEDLITNFKKFTGLERLDVSKMKIVNDELLTVVGANCPKLSVLLIIGCNSVTDTGIGGIALLPELRYLSMSDIPQVTGKQLETIYTLKILYCARCVSLENEALKQFILNAPDLEQLDVQMCKFISNSLIDVTLMAMQNRTNNLKLRIFAKDSGIEVSKIEAKSGLLEVMMERRCEERDWFVDGDLGAERIGVNGEFRLRDFRGMVFEKSTVDKDKED